MSREWSKGKKKKEFPIGFEPMTFPMHIWSHAFTTELLSHFITEHYRLPTFVIDHLRE